MDETDLRNQLADALVRSGIDKMLIRFDYRIGSHFVADCVVLNSDEKTPSLCFEIKNKKISSGLADQYCKLSRIYRKLLDVDVCYLLCLSQVGGQVVPIIEGQGIRICLDADGQTIRKFLRKDKTDVAIAQMHQANDIAIRDLKGTTWRIAPVIAFVIALNALDLLYLTQVHFISLAALAGFLIMPDLLAVMVAHPDLTEQIAKILDKALGARGHELLQAKNSKMNNDPL